MKMAILIFSLIVAVPVVFSLPVNAATGAVVKVVNGAQYGFACCKLEEPLRLKGGAIGYWYLVKKIEEIYEGEAHMKSGCHHTDTGVANTIPSASCDLESPSFARPEKFGERLGVRYPGSAIEIIGDSSSAKDEL